MNTEAPGQWAFCMRKNKTKKEQKVISPFFKDMTGVNKTLISDNKS